MNISQYLDPTQKIKYIIRLHVQQCINMQQHRTVHIPSESTFWRKGTVPVPLESILDST